MVADQFRYAWIAAQFGGAEHAVDDDAEVAGRAAGDGFYKAMCGDRFLASMDGAPSGQCAVCVAILAARCSLRGIDDRMADRPGWLSRLFCHKQPAGVGSDRRAPTPAGPQDTSAGADCAPPSESAPAGADHRRRRHAA